MCTENQWESHTAAGNGHQTNSQGGKINIESLERLPLIKFHCNPFIAFWVKLAKNKQKDKQTNKPTLSKT